MWFLESGRSAGIVRLPSLRMPNLSQLSGLAFSTYRVIQIVNDAGLCRQRLVVHLRHPKVPRIYGIGLVRSVTSAEHLSWTHHVAVGKDAQSVSKRSDT